MFACACRVGYTLDRPGIGACKPCDVAKFEAVPGPGVCTLCATGQFSGEGAEVCGCDTGFTGDLRVQPCEACEAGTYRPDPPMTLGGNPSDSLCM